MTSIEFAKQRQEEINIIKRMGQTIIDKADTIDGIVIAFETSAQNNSVDNKTTFVNSHGSINLCLGLNVTLKSYIQSYYKPKADD